MIAYSYAKVNLALDITGKDENGYHTVQTILQEIPLIDDIEFIQTPGSGKFKIKFRGDEAKLIDQKNNTVASAIKELSKQWKFKNDYEIIVDKKIPLGAGLGGGSSNAAEVIKTLNSLEIMTLTNEEMREISARIGMDVPFFIEGGSGYGIHYGEQVKVLEDLYKWSVWGDMYKLLVIPQLRKKTEQMYSKVDLNECGGNTGMTKEMLKGFEEKNSEFIFENLHNDFEKYAGEGFKTIKNALTENGADHVMLCGSGTAVFALSKNPFDLKVLSEALPNQRILNLNR